MSKIIPLGDRVLVETKHAQNETPSWIVLPDSKEKPNEWIIVEIGTLEKVKELKVGDHVYYKKYSATEVKGYVILDSEDILAKII